MSKLLSSALAGSALLALAACNASPESGEYYPARASASYPAGTIVTAPGAAVVYPSGSTVYYPYSSGSTVYYPPATAAVPMRQATDPSAYDATRQNSQSVGAGIVRMGTSVPQESGGGS